MEQKSKIIGTTTYLVTQMDAVSALKVQTKLIKICGAGILSLMGNSIDSISKLKGVAPKIIPMLIENFDDNLVNELVLSLFEKNVFIKRPTGEPQVIDFAIHFSGKAVEMWKVVGFILEANFLPGESARSSSPTIEKAEKKQEN